MLNGFLEDGIFASDSNHAILPRITALFVDGLGTSQKVSGEGIEWLERLPNAKQARIFRLPLNDEQPFLPDREKKVSSGIRTKRRHTVEPPGIAFDPVNRVRPIIQGISHHFNNLLMGIWGNATLIRLGLKESDPLYTQVCELEYVVQSGAQMIHLVLGYLGERRSVAKNLRLNQLIAQMKSELQEEVAHETELKMEHLLKWASRVQSPRLLASSTARVLEILFEGIRHYCEVMRTNENRSAAVDEKIDTICGLVGRALDITRLLRLYAADVRADTKKTGIASLIKRITVKNRKNHPLIQVNCQISPNLPKVPINAAQLEWAFEQLFTNAAASMPHGGSLSIRACTLQEQSPPNRCGVQKGSDYVVISFKDSGCGMSAKVQKHIFDPFYAYPQKHGCLGLGLAAAAGILMSHNGYIQVRSKENAGSVFNIYLPIAGAAIQEQRLKEEYI